MFLMLRWHAQDSKEGRREAGLDEEGSRMMLKWIAPHLSPPRRTSIPRKKTAEGTASCRTPAVLLLLPRPALVPTNWLTSPSFVYFTTITVTITTITVNFTTIINTDFSNGRPRS